MMADLVNDPIASCTKCLGRGVGQMEMVMPCPRIYQCLCGWRRAEPGRLMYIDMR